MSDREWQEIRVVEEDEGEYREKTRDRNEGRRRGIGDGRKRWTGVVMEE